MGMIRYLVGRIGYDPLLLTLTALLFSALLFVFAAYLYYRILVAASAKTVYSGPVSMEITLNESAGEEGAGLTMGCYYLGMEDGVNPTAVPENERFHPPLSFMGKARRREYALSVFVRRYALELAAAGLASDDCYRLLSTLRKDGVFDKMGTVSLDRRRKLLRYTGSEEFDINPNGEYSVRVRRSLPEHLRDNVSGVHTEELCITLKVFP